MAKNTGTRKGGFGRALWSFQTASSVFFWRASIYFPHCSCGFQGHLDSRNVRVDFRVIWIYVMFVVDDDIMRIDAAIHVSYLGVSCSSVTYDVSAWKNHVTDDRPQGIRCPVWHFH
ncbi:hypothetical protein ElyMa_005065500 [Elysia marginata]|uniref:Uncharacterized protein n=1 Tax=Elysia marginata TaxID=1093978 RepID=A0AAV4JD91_9GAST|nr:hypothetical protein ElyMa_005065500 [Elysia marginata]